jgi:hypothetical protein
MAQTNIAALWTPDIWIPGTREKMRLFPSLINSPVVVQTPQFDAIASGAGVSANIPFVKDASRTADEIQVENAAATKNALTSGKQVCVILNRQNAFDASALASQVSGMNPDALGESMFQLGGARVMNRQTTMLNILRGCFGGGAATNSAAAQLSAVRIEAFGENAPSPSSDNKFNPDLFIAAKSLMGELANGL